MCLSIIWSELPSQRLSELVSAFSKPAAVLFDLDGTLVDTASEFVAVVQTMRRVRKLVDLPNASIRSVVSNGAAGMIELAFNCAPGMPEFEALRDEFLNTYEDQLGSSALPYEGLRLLLDDLSRSAIPWGVVTNKMRRFAEPLMAAMEFDPPVNALITPCDVIEPKPHPEAILRCCALLHCQPEHAIYVGDHARDIEAGKRAGCYTIAAAYGYLNTEEDPAVWGADHIVSSSHELATFIRQLIQ
jgi:2-phosphoglycolate phosphatase